MSGLDLISALFDTDLDRLKRAFQSEDPRGVPCDTFIWLLAAIVPALRPVLSTMTARHESEYSRKRRRMQERAANVEEQARLLTESRWRQQQRERERAAQQQQQIAANAQVRINPKRKPSPPSFSGADGSASQQHSARSFNTATDDPALLEMLKPAIPKPQHSPAEQHQQPQQESKTIFLQSHFPDPATMTFSDDERAAGIRLRASLETLFFAADITGDGLVSWDEMYSFCISTTMSHRMALKPSDAVRLYGVARQVKRPSQNIAVVAHFPSLRAIGIASRHESVELIDPQSLRVLARTTSTLAQFDKDALIKPSTYTVDEEMAERNSLSALINSGGGAPSVAMAGTASSASVAGGGGAGGGATVGSEAPSITRLVYAEGAGVLVAAADNLRLYVWSVSVGGDPAAVVRGKHLPATHFKLNPVCSEALEHSVTQMRTASSAARLVFLSNTAGQLLCYEVFAVHTPRLRYCFSLVSTPGTPVTDFCFMAPTEHRIISCGYDRLVRVTDLHLLSEGHAAEGAFWVVGESEHVCTHVAYSPEYELIVTASIDLAVRAWTCHATRRPAQLFFDSSNPHQGRMVSLFAVPGTPQLVSADSAGAIKVWDVRTFRAAQSLVVGAGATEVVDEAAALHEHGSAHAAGSVKALFFNKSAQAMSRDLALNAACYVEGHESFVCCGPQKLVLHKYDAGASPNRATEESYVVGAAIVADQGAILTLTPQSLVQWEARGGTISASVAAADVAGMMPAPGASVALMDDFSAMACDVQDRRVLAGTRKGRLIIWSTHGLNRIQAHALQPHGCGNSNSHSDAKRPLSSADEDGFVATASVVSVTGVAFCAPRSSIVSIGTDGAMQIQRLDSKAATVFASRFMFTADHHQQHAVSTPGSQLRAPPLTALSVSDFCAVAACGDDAGNLYVCDVLAARMQEGLLFRSNLGGGAVTCTAFLGAFPALAVATADGWVRLLTCRPAPDGIELAKWRVPEQQQQQQRPISCAPTTASSRNSGGAAGGGFTSASSSPASSRPTSAYIARAVRSELSAVTNGFIPAPSASSLCGGASSPLTPPHAAAAATKNGRPDRNAVSELLDSHHEHKRRQQQALDVPHITAMHFDAATHALVAGLSDGALCAWSVCPVLTRHGLRTTSFVSMGEYLNYKWRPASTTAAAAAVDVMVPPLIALRRGVHRMDNDDAASSSSPCAVVSVDCAPMAENAASETMVVTAGDMDQRVCVSVLRPASAAEALLLPFQFAAVGDLAYGRASTSAGHEASSIGNDKIGAYAWPRSAPKRPESTADVIDEDDGDTLCVPAHRCAEFYYADRVCEHLQQSQQPQQQEPDGAAELAAELGDVLLRSAAAAEGTVSAHRVLNPPQDVIATGYHDTARRPSRDGPAVVDDPVWQKSIDERNKVVRALRASSSSVSVNTSAVAAASESTSFMLQPRPPSASASFSLQLQQQQQQQQQSRIRVTSAPGSARRKSEMMLLLHPHEDSGVSVDAGAGAPTSTSSSRRKQRLTTEEIAAMQRRGAALLEEQARKMREREDELEREQAARNLAEAEVASVACSAASTRDLIKEAEALDAAPSLPSDLAPSQLLLAASHEQRRLAAQARLPDLFVGPRSAAYCEAQVIAQRKAAAAAALAATQGSSTSSSAALPSFTFQPAPSLLEGVICGDGMMCTATERPRTGSQLRSRDAQALADRAVETLASSGPGASSLTARAILTSRVGLRVGSNVSNSVTRPGSGAGRVGTRSGASMTDLVVQAAAATGDSDAAAAVAATPAADATTARRKSRPASGGLVMSSSGALFDRAPVPRPQAPPAAGSAFFRGVLSAPTPTSIPSPRMLPPAERRQQQLAAMRPPSRGVSSAARNAAAAASTTLSERRDAKIADYQKALRRVMRWPNAGGVPMDRDELKRQAMLEHHLAVN